MAIQFLRGSASKINSSTTKLSEGQPLVDISNGRLYVGDGKTQIKDLEPINKLLPHKKFAGNFYLDASSSSNGNGAASGLIAENVDSNSETLNTWMNADVIPIRWKSSTYSTGADNLIWGYAHRVYSEKDETGDEYEMRDSYFLTLRPTSLGGGTWKLYYIHLKWDDYYRNLTWELSSAL